MLVLEESFAYNGCKSQILNVNRKKRNLPTQTPAQYNSEKKKKTKWKKKRKAKYKKKNRKKKENFWIANSICLPGMDWRDIKNMPVSTLGAYMERSWIFFYYYNKLESL